MKSKLLIVIALFIIILIVVYLTMIRFGFTPRRWSLKMVSPAAGIIGATSKPQSNITPTPAPTAQQFQFDKNSDLKKELDAVNPQVQDSDFVNLGK